MYKRIFDIEGKLDEGMFLFGARQTGKSTLLRERFKEAIFYDLLNPKVRKAFKLNPNSLLEALQDKPAGTLVIVDEIQKVPELLDAVHWLMVNRGLHFILSGSSARKLKKSGANTLGGRANPRTLFPLVWKDTWKSISVRKSVTKLPFRMSKPLNSLWKQPPFPTVR